MLAERALRSEDLPGQQRERSRVHEGRFGGRQISAMMASRCFQVSGLLDSEPAEAVVEPAGFAAELLGEEIEVRAAVRVGAPGDEAGFVQALAVEVDCAVFAPPSGGDLLGREFFSLRELLEDPDADGMGELGVELQRDFVVECGCDFGWRRCGREWRGCGRGRCRVGLVTHKKSGLNRVFSLENW